MFIARPQSALLQGPAHAPPSCPALAALRRQPCQITTHQRSMWAPRHWPQPGGHGGLQILPNGSMKWGVGNFLIRTRQLFAERGLMVAVVDAPSDRQSPPYLGGFRQTPEHAADLKAVIARLRQNAKAPVRLVGTSRETQSAARASGLFFGGTGASPSGARVPDSKVHGASRGPGESSRLRQNKASTLRHGLRRPAARSVPRAPLPWRC